VAKQGAVNLFVMKVTTARALSMVATHKIHAITVNILKAGS